MSVSFPKYDWNRRVTIEPKILGYNYWRVGDIIKGIDDTYENVLYYLQNTHMYSKNEIFSESEKQRNTVFKKQTD